MSALVQTVAPTDDPVTVDEVKSQLGITTGGLDDGIIEGYRDAAVLEVEARQKRQLMSATYKLYLDAFPVGDIEIPKPPLSSVTSIQYIDTAGDTQTWASSEYSVNTDSTKGRVRPLPAYTYPSAVGTDYQNPVIITFVAGYADAASVPANTKLAIKALAAHYYENREPYIVGKTISKIPDFLDSLIATEAILEAV